jgi:hypothetical protein
MEWHDVCACPQECAMRGRAVQDLYRERSDRRRSFFRSRGSHGLILFLLFQLLTAQVSTAAERPTARIVGIGATTCQMFSREILSDPRIRRDYLAWAQGYMSAILQSRPSGVDEGLDLAPPSFDLVKQFNFLEQFCATNVALEFADAVTALYKRLRQEGKT